MKPTYPARGPRPGRDHRILFDAGTSPDGVAENMRRLDVDPSEIEVIVCSHGHFDHTAGLDGLVRRLGRVQLPVLIHPHFWRQRRVTIPGYEPFEIPTTSRRALHEAASRSPKTGGQVSSSNGRYW